MTAPAGGNRAAPFVDDSITSSSSVLSEPTASAQLNSSDPLAGDGLLIWKFWKSPRNRRDTIVLRLKQYENVPYLDCRQFTTNAAGQSVPTQKGVTVGMRSLPEFLRAVDKACTRALDLGLIKVSSS